MDRGGGRGEGKADDTLPKTVESQEELDFLRALHGADDLHGGLAAGAAQRVAAPGPDDQVAPERSQHTGGLFRRWGEEADLIVRGLLFHGHGSRGRDEHGAVGGGHAAALVGV